MSKIKSNGLNLFNNLYQFNRWDLKTQLFKFSASMHQQDRGILLRPRPRPRHQGSRPRLRQWKLQARQCLEAPHHWRFLYVFCKVCYCCCTEIQQPSCRAWRGWAVKTTALCSLFIFPQLELLKQMSTCVVLVNWSKVSYVLVGGLRFLHYYAPAPVGEAGALSGHRRPSSVCPSVCLMSRTSALTR